MTPRISDPAKITEVDGFGPNPEIPQHDRVSSGIVSLLRDPSGGHARESGGARSGAPGGGENSRHVLEILRCQLRHYEQDILRNVKFQNLTSISELCQQLAAIGKAFRFNRPPFGKHCKTFRRSHQVSARVRAARRIPYPDPPVPSHLYTFCIRMTCRILMTWHLWAQKVKMRI
jgi:hypothetical protein